MRSIISDSMLDLYRSNHVKTNERANNCKIFKIKYDKRTTIKNRFIFYVKCFENYSNLDGWIVSVVYQNIDHDKQRNRKKPLNTDVKVKCNCPAFLYWGSAFNATENNYNWNFVEVRPPNIRDPKRERKICKHLAHVRTKLRNKTFKQMRKQYSSIDEIEEINWTDTIPSIKKSLQLKNMSIKEIESNLKVLNSLNYEQFLEKFDLIIKV